MQEIVCSHSSRPTASQISASIATPTCKPLYQPILFVLVPWSLIMKHCTPPYPLCNWWRIQMPNTLLKGPRTLVCWKEVLADLLLLQQTWPCVKGKRQPCSISFQVQPPMPIIQRLLSACPSRRPGRLADIILAISILQIVTLSNLLISAGFTEGGYDVPSWIRDHVWLPSQKG